MTKPLRRTTRDVFGDLGFAAPESENLRIRADLMIRLSRMIERRGLTQGAAARLFGVSQPRVSDLVRGKIERFSVDGLLEMMGQAGERVTLVVRPARRRVA